MKKEYKVHFSIKSHGDLVVNSIDDVAGFPVNNSMEFNADMDINDDIRVEEGVLYIHFSEPINERTKVF